MSKFWYIFYNTFVITPLVFISRIAGIFNPKLRRGLKARKKLFEKLIIDLTGIDRKKKMIWFHSASLGEFEQAKPIIQELKAKKNVNIIVTFFSPSGYDNSLKYPYADIIAYMPIDKPFPVKRFLSLVKPSLAIFMRYDIWPNFIWQLAKNKIPVFIADATMQTVSKRKWPFVKSFHKSLYSSISRILTVSETDKSNFKEFNVGEKQLQIIGDTRFDRVYQKSQDAKNKKLFRDGILDNKKVFVFGSSWEGDEEVILPAMLKILKNDPDVIMIIAPHEPTLLRLEKLEHEFEGEQKSIRFSLMNNYDGERIILIDSIGILLTLYYYADCAYVGGSMKFRVHNVLEPAVYGIPVFYGPKINTSREAIELAEVGGGIILHNKKEAYRKLRSVFANNEERERIGEISSDYVSTRTGATTKILSEIYSYLK